MGKLLPSSGICGYLLTDGIFTHAYIQAHLTHKRTVSVYDVRLNTLWDVHESMGTRGRRLSLKSDVSIFKLMVKLTRSGLG